MSCNPLSPDSMKYLVRVPLISPYAFRWILPNTPQDGDIGSVDYVKQITPATRKNGAVIHEGNERVAQNSPFGKWQTIGIEVDGELMVAASNPEPDLTLVQSTGNRSSLLKARATLDLGNARTRSFDFDIAAGVGFAVPAYSVQKLEVLVPDPRVEIPFERDPVGVDPGPLQSATVLTTSAYFTAQQPNTRSILTYTTPIFITAADATWFVPRAQESVEIQLALNTFTVGTSIVLLDFLYVPEGIREATQVAPTTFFLLDQLTLDVLGGPSRSMKVAIPGNANAYRLTRSVVTPFTFVNVIEFLEP